MFFDVWFLFVPQDVTNTLEEAELHILWRSWWSRSELVLKLVGTEATAEMQELWQCRPGRATSGKNVGPGAYHRHIGIIIDLLENKG